MNGIPSTGTRDLTSTPTGEEVIRIPTKRFHGRKCGSTEAGSTTEAHSGSDSTSLRDSSAVEHVLGKDETRVRFPFLDLEIVHREIYKL